MIKLVNGPFHGEIWDGCDSEIRKGRFVVKGIPLANVPVLSIFQVGMPEGKAKAETAEYRVDEADPETAVFVRSL